MLFLHSFEKSWPVTILRQREKRKKEKGWKWFFWKRLALFNEETPIYTKDKDTTPTRYLSNGSVKNCFVADGCVIDGEIENSIIFRSVHVKKGTKIKNSIILQQSDIGENVELENVIVDKKVMIRDNKRLIGTEEFPIVVGKSKVI